MNKIHHIILDLDGTIILDLDGTIICDDSYNINPRQNVEFFLDFCFENFLSVSIWTANTIERYNDFIKVLSKKYEFRFIWTSNRCSRRYIISNHIDCGMTIIKYLSKVWRRYSDMSRYNTLILDNTPTTYYYNYGNAISIKTYISKIHIDDNELLKLVKF